MRRWSRPAARGKCASPSPCASTRSCGKGSPPSRRRPGRRSPGFCPERGWRRLPTLLWAARAPRSGSSCALVPPSPGSQPALCAAYDYHAFISDRERETLALEADHRRQTEIDNVTRDPKYGVGLNHLPSVKFGANAAWLAFQVMAHNLGLWVKALGVKAGPLRMKPLRHRYLHLPGRPGPALLPGPATAWPWQDTCPAAPARLRVLPHLSSPEGGPGKATTGGPRGREPSPNSFGRSFPLLTSPHPASVRQKPRPSEAGSRCQGRFRLWSATFRRAGKTGTGGFGLSETTRPLARPHRSRDNELGSR